ncbi:MAG: DUF4433 domain-containing protein [Candidatus Delongbacteria bacterium]|nr:DUF4433 domain-containing protein [Candidatus Delongbacteria bacterium]MCG2760575.1 DUF4433 domain-containing protein [Candidatus Delongbacteria bacterium]
MRLNEIKLYRMTHIENIPHILSHGITHKNSPNSNPDYVMIGDTSIIETRTNKRVTVDNGEYLLTAREIVLGDFIPFYFGVRMPMLYVIQNGGNFVERPTPAEDIIYLKCSLVEVAEAISEFYFSDGHAVNRYTSFFDNSNLHLLPDIIDWKAVRLHFWGGEENLDIKRKMEAEFLIRGDLSPDLISGFICNGQTTKQKLIDFGIDETKITINPEAYY